MVSKSVRVHANIGVSHINRIVSKSPTSSTEWSRHSIIFADASVHFPNYDLDILFRPKLLSSVRLYDFVCKCFFGFVPYEKYFACRREVREFAARVSRSRLSGYSTRELFLLPARTHLPGCNSNGGISVPVHFMHARINFARQTTDRRNLPYLVW